MLLIVGSVAHRNDRSVLIRQHVIPIDLTPLMPLCRAAKVILPIVNLIASIPVVLLDF